MAFTLRLMESLNVRSFMNDFSIVAHPSFSKNELNISEQINPFGRFFRLKEFKQQRPVLWLVKP